MRHLPRAVGATLRVVARGDQGGHSRRGGAVEVRATTLCGHHRLDGAVVAWATSNHKTIEHSDLTMLAQ